MRNKPEIHEKSDFCVFAAKTGPGDNLDHRALKVLEVYFQWYDLSRPVIINK